MERKGIDGSTRPNFSEVETISLLAIIFFLIFFSSSTGIGFEVSSVSSSLVEFGFRTRGINQPPF